MLVWVRCLKLGIIKERRKDSTKLHDDICLQFFKRDVLKSMEQIRQNESWEVLECVGDASDPVVVCHCRIAALVSRQHSNR